MPTVEEVNELSRRYKELVTSLESEREGLDPKMKAQRLELNKQIATLDNYANGMKTQDYNAYMQNYRKLVAAVLSIENLKEERAVSMARYDDTVQSIRGKQERMVEPAHLKKSELKTLEASSLHKGARLLDQSLTVMIISLKDYHHTKDKKQRTYSSNAKQLNKKCDQWADETSRILAEIKKGDESSEPGIRNMLRNLLADMQATLQYEQKHMGHHFFKSEYTGIVSKASDMVRHIEQMIEPEVKAQPKKG